LTKARLDPFMNESQVLVVDGLTIESRSDRVSLFGQIDLTRDKSGLERALQLKAELDAVVLALQKDHALPDAISLLPEGHRKNPF
jgi:hypothetical protein